MPAPLHPAASPVRDVRHLGDFTATPRLLLITALALPIGAVERRSGVGAAAADRPDHQPRLLPAARHRAGRAGRRHHHPLLVLLAPVAGGLVIGLMARFGSEKIRGHGMPEAIEAILIGGSKVAAAGRRC